MIDYSSTGFAVCYWICDYSSFDILADHSWEVVVELCIRSLLLHKHLNTEPSVCQSVLQDHEKARRKKVPAVNAEETVRVESTSAVPSQYVDVRVVSDPIMAVSTQQNRFPTTSSSAPLSAPAIATAVNPTSIASSVSMPSTDVFTFESLKQEKAKATQKNSQIGGKIVDMSVKKKVKKKAENLMGELPLRPEKLSSHQADDRQKQHKHAAAGQFQNVPVNQITMNSNLSR